LTGKYTNGIPEDSRAALKGYGFVADRASDRVLLDKIAGLAPIAAELGCTQAQLALAWCTLNPNVTSVITGASRVSQVTENFEAIEVAAAITPEIASRIESLFA
jgi:aryl-alcohol dehydrogenase-like predicted oxidoreductase